MRCDPSPSASTRLSRASTAHRKDETLTGGVKDIELFRNLALRHFDAIITMDGRQLENQDERDALASNNLHWIGFNMPTARGANAIARQSATILAGMPYVLDHWADTPTAYRLPELPGTPPDIEPLRPSGRERTQPRL